MKPRERPPASPRNDGRVLYGTLGSDPVHQDRPHQWARLVDLTRFLVSKPKLYSRLKWPRLLLFLST